MVRPPAVLDVFSVIGHPRRRAIVSALAGGDKAVSELVSELGVSQPTVSEHLAALKAVGLVDSSKRGRVHLYHFDPAPLRDVTDWIAHLEGFWSERIDRLSRLVAEIDKEERQ